MFDGRLEVVDSAPEKRHRVVKQLRRPADVKVTWFQVGIVSSSYQVAEMYPCGPWKMSSSGPSSSAAAGAAQATWPRIVSSSDASSSRQGIVRGAQAASHDRGEGMRPDDRASDLDRSRAECLLDLHGDRLPACLRAPGRAVDADLG